MMSPLRAGFRWRTTVDTKAIEAVVVIVALSGYASAAEKATAIGAQSVKTRTNIDANFVNFMSPPKSRKGAFTPPRAHKPKSMGLLLYRLGEFFEIVKALDF